MGSAHPLNAPYQAFQAADGWIVVGGANQTNWLRTLDAIGAPELADDPRFRNGADRMGCLPELEAELAERFRAKEAAYWLEVLDQKDVPCGPVYDMLEALNDPQTAARKMLVEVEHSTLGPVKTLGLPVKFSKTPGHVLKGASIFGEDTREILTQTGFSRQEIEAFQKEGAVVCAET
jgi:crotonobetainyl-CoA:carnitine CoA-transferase CaiB-like acyl-CoA transferase